MSKKTVQTDVIVFGLGEIFNVLKTYLYENYNIVAFADNDTEKQGTLLDNIEIVSPKDIFTYKFDKIIVTVTGYQKHVIKQLLDLGVDKDDIILGVNFLMLNDEGNGYEYYIDNQLDISFKCNLSKCTIVPIEKKGFRYLTPTKDAVITPALITSGEFSQEELDTFFLLANVYFGEQNGIFLDVGANIGTTSLQATKNDRVSEVIAIEPSSENFALLQCNIHLNKLHKIIRAKNAAVSDTNGTVNLVISPVLASDNRVSGTSFISTNAQVEDIESITIDTLAEDCAHEIVFMWVDVQGYEYYVLKGAKNLISTSQKLAIQIEFWPFGLKETNTLKLLCQFCKETFSKYIDMKEYIEGVNVVHDIDEIDSLSIKYKKTHTDLFLIQ